MASENDVNAVLQGFGTIGQGFGQLAARQEAEKQRTRPLSESEQAYLARAQRGNSADMEYLVATGQIEPRAAAIMTQFGIAPPQIQGPTAPAPQGPQFAQPAQMPQQAQLPPPYTPGHMPGATRAEMSGPAASMAPTQQPVPQPAPPPMPPTPPSDERGNFAYSAPRARTDPEFDIARGGQTAQDLETYLRLAPHMRPKEPGLNFEQRLLLAQEQNRGRETVAGKQGESRVKAAEITAGQKQADSELDAKVAVQLRGMIEKGLNDRQKRDLDLKEREFNDKLEKAKSKGLSQESADRVELAFKRGKEALRAKTAILNGMAALTPQTKDAAQRLVKEADQVIAESNQIMDDTSNGLVSPAFTSIGQKAQGSTKDNKGPKEPKSGDFYGDSDREDGEYKLKNGKTIVVRNKKAYLK